MLAQIPFHQPLSRRKLPRNDPLFQILEQFFLSHNLLWYTISIPYLLGLSTSFSFLYTSLMRIAFVVPPIQDFYLTPHRLSALGARIVTDLCRRAGHEVALFLFPSKDKSRSLPLPREASYLLPSMVPGEFGPLSFFTRFQHFGPTFEACAQRILEFHPDAILISSFAFTYGEEAVALAQAIKAKVPEVAIAVGGSGPSSCPEYYLRQRAFGPESSAGRRELPRQKAFPTKPLCMAGSGFFPSQTSSPQSPLSTNIPPVDPFYSVPPSIVTAQEIPLFDFVVAGEGEVTVPLLLERLEGRAKGSGQAQRVARVESEGRIKGLGRTQRWGLEKEGARTQGERRAKGDGRTQGEGLAQGNRRARCTACKGSPSGAEPQLIRAHRLCREDELEAGLAIVRETADEVWVTTSLSRGCPKGCRFCSNHLCHGREFRTLPMEKFEKALKRIPSGRFLHLNFEDDNLLYTPEYFFEVLRLVKSRWPQAEFTAENGLDYNFLDPPSIDRLVQYGFRRFNLSLGTIFPETALQEERPLNLERYLEVIEAIRRRGASSITYFIAGLEGDTPERIVRQIQYLAPLPTLIGISLFYPVPGIPGFIPPPSLLLRHPGLGRGSFAYPWTGSLTTEELVTAFRLCRYVNLLKKQHKTPEEEALIQRIREKGRLLTFQKQKPPHRKDSNQKGHWSLQEVPVQDSMVKQFFSH